jgi:predicted nucleotidyltransferase
MSMPRTPVTRQKVPAGIARLVADLGGLTGVEAVVLGGSRAVGEHRADSDWDLGVYYRGRFDAEAVRRLGLPGEVSEPGAWAGFMNGGAFLSVEGVKVDVLYRDLTEIDHWAAEAEAGRWELRRCPGYLAGMASYVLLGEAELGHVLHGELRRPGRFPDALRESAPARWRWERDFALMYAAMHHERDDDVAASGALAVAAVAEAYARLAERGEWALNDKGVLARAGVTLDQLGGRA